MTSASAMARRAAARMASCSRYSGSSSPGESVKMNCVSPRVSKPTTGRRVDCGLGETIARCWPSNAFKSVDLPTLGRPASTTVPQRVMGAKLTRKVERGTAAEQQWKVVHERDSRPEVPRSKHEARPSAPNELRDEKLAAAYSPTTSRSQYHRR